MTAALLELDVEKHELTYWNAGAPAVLVIDENKRVTGISLASPTLGGAGGEFLPASKVLPFPPGSSFFAFTDGLTEMENPAGKQFGLRRTKQVLSEVAGLKAADIRQSLATVARDYMSTSAQNDDITFLMLQRE
jgi:sigma-B regulation protein RsbU (phosphoserine phosphatase)